MSERAERFSTFRDELVKEAPVVQTVMLQPTVISERTIEVVSSQRLFRPKQMKEMLGIGNSTYYRITRLGLLRFSRLTPGGPRVHTEKQYNDYLEYLNANEVTVAPAFPRRVARY